MDKGFTQAPIDSASNAPDASGLRIAFCLPEIQRLQQVTSGTMVDAPYIQQKSIADSLLARGHKLTFVAPSDLNEVVCTDDLALSKLAVRTWSASPWFNLASKAAWWTQQKLGIPYLNVFANYRHFDACLHCLPGHDLVYERNGLYKIDVAMACKRLGLPYVLFLDADEIMEHDYMGKPITGILRWRAKNMVRYNLNAADCVICVSEPAKANLVTNWQMPAAKIVVFPNGVDVERFQPYPATRAEIRATLGVETNPLLIFVGSFYGWHDVTTLLEAFAQVLVAQPGARLALVGDGEQRHAMQQRADQLGIGHAVQFTGSVPHAEVPRLVSAADVAVAPYPMMQHDLWLSPMKLFEYMASGMAVIASAVGQIGQVVQDGTNGLLVPPGDVTALAVAMQRLISDATLRARLGRQARIDIKQKYSWERYVSRLERLYAAVIAGQSVQSI
ncbi:MAG: glycosyltransferase family 4 protein [Chloroflexi bacterium]|nr:glycosyltransferase family 4 protein [Chloroflexota bacterium]